MSRQREWQLRKKAEGLCQKCGTEPTSGSLCRDCYLNQRIGGKKVYSKIRPNMEWFVRKEAESLGWRVVRSGWPDFLLVRNGELWFIEVKRPSRFDHVSKAQAAMIETLKEHGFQVAVVRSPAELKKLLPS